jgi:hypothetical protein
MIKTIKKKNKNKSKSKVYNKTRDCPEVTYKGIHKWHSAMFEKLGWMILAKEKGMSYKIAPYKMSLQKLKCAILKKHQTMNDMDKKKDLEIMAHNVDILIKHANKDF